MAASPVPPQEQPPSIVRQEAGARRPRIRAIRSLGRSIGLGLVTGAADDDCSAIGTYASAGAKFGYSLLWTAPLTFPMMVVVVYLSGKLGKVAGEGLFAVMRRHYARWFVYSVLAGVIAGNTIEAGADIGGMAAALNIFLPVSIKVLAALIALAALVLQFWGSYTLIRNVFRVLAMALLAYVISAFLAHPSLAQVVRGTLVPSLHFNRELLAMVEAIIGTTLSAYLYTWQSNQEVEEEIAAGKTRLQDRRGASKAELKHSLWDVIYGMLFSNIVMYFIILSTAATLFVAGKREISSAAEAAQALVPLAGKAAGALFAVGIVGVGFLAVPVMTTGAAYDVSQSFGWKQGLSRKPRQAKKFYGSIAVFTLVAAGINCLGINPMKALVWAGIVQGFSTPPLLLLIMRMTNNRKIMGDKTNRRATNVLGWSTTAVISSVTAALLISWLR